MKNELISLLKEILPEFVKTNQPVIVRTGLQLHGYLTTEDIDFISHCISKTDQFLEMFNTLHAKPDDTFKILQKICLKEQWRDLFALLQKRLMEYQRADLLISEHEQPKHRKIFTYGLRPPMPQFTGREEYLKEMDTFLKYGENHEASFVRTLVICGLGGVGKTQLTITYMTRHQQDFDSIVWLNAESESALTNSVYSLASVLDVTVEKSSNLESIMHKVFSKISVTGMRHLAIFDNADELKLQNIVSNVSQNISVLITSRHQSWPNSKILYLDVLSIDEAKNFVLKLLNVEESQALKLVKTLQCFPLTIQQATVYIMHMSYLSTFTIADYLKEYEANAISAKKLLMCHFPKRNQDVSAESIFATWKITFNKIGYNSRGTEEESLALKILYVISFLASDNIPTSLFLQLTGVEKESIGSAIDVLKDFCLLTLNINVLKVHKMVQFVTQLQLVEDVRNVEFLICAAELLRKSFPYEKQSSSALETKRILLPHMISVASHLEYVYQKLGQMEKYFEHHCSLLQCIRDAYSDFGDAQNNKKTCIQLLLIQETGYGEQHPELANTLSHLSSALMDLGDPNTSKSLLTRALMIEEHNYGAESEQFAATLSNLSITERELCNQQNAISLLERALKIQEACHGHCHFQLVGTLINLSTTYRQLGNTENAKTLLERALKIQECHYGQFHIEIPATLNSLSIIYRQSGDFKTAKELLERALNIKESCYGTNHYQLGVTLCNLSDVHKRLGNKEMAKSLCEKALAIEEHHYGPDHVNLAATLSNLSTIYADLDNKQQAKTLLERALLIQERHYGSEYFRLAVTLSNLSITERQLGNLPKAKTLMERALAIREAHYGTQSLQVAKTLNNLVYLYKEFGDITTAKSLFERGRGIEQLHKPQHEVVKRTKSLQTSTVVSPPSKQSSFENAAHMETEAISLNNLFDVQDTADSLLKLELSNTVPNTIIKQLSANDTSQSFDDVVHNSDALNSLEPLITPTNEEPKFIYNSTQTILKSNSRTIDIFLNDGSSSDAAKDVCNMLPYLDTQKDATGFQAKTVKKPSALCKQENVVNDIKIIKSVGSSKFQSFTDRFRTLSALVHHLTDSGFKRCSIILGIDFSDSNIFQGYKTFQYHSLHDTSTEDNPYQKVLKILGTTLESFSNDNNVYAYGFGDKETSKKKIFSFSDDLLKPCAGFAEVLSRYNYLVKQVTLSGPKSYAPLVNHAIKIAKNNGTYHILVIISDGQLTDPSETAQAIIEASSYPLSIIMVGVGDGPWKTMEEFDDLLPERKFDNFQFVDFHKVIETKTNARLAFALHSLMEIPDQFKAIQKLDLLK